MGFVWLFLLLAAQAPSLGAGAKLSGPALHLLQVAQAHARASSHSQSQSHPHGHQGPLHGAAATPTKTSTASAPAAPAAPATPVAAASLPPAELFRDLVVLLSTSALIESRQPTLLARSEVATTSSAPLPAPPLPLLLLLWRLQRLSVCSIRGEWYPSTSTMGRHHD